ncbi:MAG: site-specific integrase [Oscillospiraceae bacterium]|nr:site-specific integrase [Oscillospiraceae bacterium]
MANITKRGNTFRIRVFVGTDTNGKKLMKSTTFTPPDGVTPKKAEKLAQEYAFEFEKHCKGYSQLNENMRFSELADWYFTNYAPHELKESTVYTYKGQYKNHIEPVLCNMKVKDITTPKLTQIMQSYDLNPATVRKLYVIVQSIFHRGAEQGFIRESPCHNVILPKRKKSTKNKALDEDKLKRFISFLDSKPWNEDFKRIIKVLLYTGMRSGECLALAWEDIDFENHTISINHTLTDIGGKHELTTPKTESSIRIIGMGQELNKILLEQKAYIKNLELVLGDNFAHPEMVFVSALGNYRDRNSVYHSLKRFTKGTEFEDMTLHQLRHCNATMLLNSGFDLKVVSEHLGHCDISVTADIYADVLRSMKAKTAEQIELLLK